MLQQSPAVRVAFGGMTALAAAMGIGRFVYTPILPSMADALLLSKSTAGLIAAANFLGYLAGALLAAVPWLPGSRRAWMLAALCAGAATTAGMACGSTTAVFMLLRFAGGAASALVLVFGSALVMERLATLGHGTLAALHFAGVGLGIAMSAAMLAALQMDGVGWRWLWLAAGGLAALAVPLCAVLVPRDESAVPRPTGNQAAPARPVTSLRWLYLSYGLFGFGYVITATFLVQAMHAAFGGPMAGLIAWLVVGLAAIPSTAVWSRFGRRFGPLRAYSVACLVAAAGVATGGVWPAAAGALLAAFLLGGTFMGLTALGFEAARAMMPSRQRRSFAVMTACFGTGQIAGPLIAGWLIDRSGGFLAPSLMGAAALLLSGLLALEANRGRRSQRQARLGTALGH